MENNNSFLPRENENVSPSPRGVCRLDWLAAEGGRAPAVQSRSVAGSSVPPLSLTGSGRPRRRASPAGQRLDRFPPALPGQWRRGWGEACPGLADLTASARSRGRQRPTAGLAMLLWERRRAPPGANHGSPRGGRSRLVASHSLTALLLLPGLPTGTPGPAVVVSPRPGPAAAGGRAAGGSEVGQGQGSVWHCVWQLQVLTGVSDPLNVPVAAAAPSPSQAGTPICRRRGRWCEGEVAVDAGFGFAQFGPAASGCPVTLLEPERGGNPVFFR